MTPIGDDFAGGMTPIAGYTPAPGAQSVYSMANTPHYDGGFTPGQALGSPMYSPNPFQTPNPGMSTPGYVN